MKPPTGSDGRFAKSDALAVWGTVLMMSSVEDELANGRLVVGWDVEYKSCEPLASTPWLDCIEPPTVVPSRFSPWTPLKHRSKFNRSSIG